MLSRVSWLFLVPFIASCALTKRGPSEKQKLQLRDNAVSAALRHVRARLPRGKVFYAGVAANSFANGSPVRVIAHRANYLGRSESLQNKGEVIHQVRVQARVAQGRLLDVLELKYIFTEDLQQQNGLRMQFIYGFPKKNYMSQKDPLEAYRKGPSRRWLPVIQKRGIEKGMPEAALLLSWGSPLSVQSMTVLSETVKEFVYGGYTVTIRGDRVSAWRQESQ